MAKHGEHGEMIKKMMSHGKSRKQAIAIALSEMSGKKKKKKKATLDDV